MANQRYELWKLTPFEQWVVDEGIKVVREQVIQDIRTVETAPWERTGCDAALLDLTADPLPGSVVENQGTIRYVLDIPPGGKIPEERHMYEEIFYVVEGRGAATVWAEEDGPNGRGSVGDEVVAPGGRARLSVRVQCPNWLDVNRVQVLLNGRAVASLNHTRRSTPRLFSDGTVAFEAEIPLTLERDAHVIVVAAGEGQELGPVLGPGHAGDVPIAVSNPIFVDVDGDGFRPNGDLLGVPLPLPGPEEGGS